MEENSQTFVGLLSGTTLQPVDFTLPDETRSGICEALDRLAADPATLKFLDLLEAELGRYKVLEAQRQQQVTLKQRVKVLKDLSVSTSQVIDRLSKLATLDYRILESGFCTAKGIHRPLIPELTRDGALPDAILELDKDLRILPMLLKGLQNFVESEIKPGAPAKKSRDELIDSIVRSYQTCFDEWPASTNEGDFEHVLRLCLKCVDVVIAYLHREILNSRKRVRGK